MRVHNASFSKLGELYQKLDLTHYDPKRTLIQVFTGLTSEFEVRQIQAVFNDKNPELGFIGATTSGEICNGHLTEDSIVVSIVEFEHSEVTYGAFSDEKERQLGVDLATQLFSESTKVAVVFADGLNLDGNDIIEGITSVNQAVPIAGGMAGDNGEFTDTLVFTHEVILTQGVVAAVVNSSTLQVMTDFELNWQSIGQSMTVTKVEKNRLYELDGKSVCDVYTEYLGGQVGDNLPYSAPEFPLLKQLDSGLEICRAFTHRFDDGSLQTIGHLEEGDQVRFSFGNVGWIIESTKRNLERYRELNLEVIFAYSCLGRKSFLQDQVANELTPIAEIAPMSGFFTYGEFFHHSGRNDLLNLSLTFLGLSERSDEHQEIKSAKVKITDMAAAQHEGPLGALTHLTNKVIDELNEANQQLESSRNQLKDQANRDYLTNLYNRRFFNGIAQQFLRDALRQRERLSVLMIDIDKFKLINDTYGHPIGDKVIKCLAHLLEICTRNSDIVSRFGGEEFAILLPHTGREGALTIADKVRETVEKNKVLTEKGYILHTVSIGVSEVDVKHEASVAEALDRADGALYTAKQAGRNRVELA